MQALVSRIFWITLWIERHTEEQHPLDSDWEVRSWWSLIAMAVRPLWTLSFFRQHFEGRQQRHVQQVTQQEQSISSSSLNTTQQFLGAWASESSPTSSSVSPSPESPDWLLINDPVELTVPLELASDNEDDELANPVPWVFGTTIFPALVDESIEGGCRRRVLALSSQNEVDDGSECVWDK